MIIDWAGARYLFWWTLFILGPIILCEVLR